jgi:tetratricopeptide (TPR) repeat protein
MRRIVAGFGVLVLIPLASACAGTLPRPTTPVAAVPELESRLARDSADDPARAALSAAYRQDGDLERARVLLVPAAARRDAAPVIPLELGVTYERMERYPEAIEAYRRYLAVGRDRELRAHVRRRLPLLARMLLVAEANAGLAREAELAATPPRPDAVAVLPFDAEGLDPALRPLGSAMAELLATDLGQTRRLRVLERVRIQALFDEIRLGESGAVDSATAARGGRLLGAGRVVRGDVQGNEQSVTLQAVVVRAGDAGRAAALSERDALRALFDAEKRLALDLYGSMGIELTLAERARVLTRRVDDLQALVEYGLGLEAEDGGDFAAAALHYTQAATLDPGFDEAAERAERSEEMAAAAAMDPETLSALALASVDASRVLDSVLAIQSLVPTLEGGRDFFAEVSGAEGIGTRAILDVVLHPK